MIENGGSSRYRLDLQKFNIPERTTLSLKNERLLVVLEQAVEKAAIVYAAQVNEDYPGANFYPHDASVQEIDTAAKADPRIDDPYYVVGRDKTGALIPIPYHIKYAPQLKPIIEHLRIAASSGYAPTLDQATYFLAIAESLQSGTHDEAMAKWIRVEKEPVVDAMIAFTGTYGDKLRNRKSSPIASSGILDCKGTAKAQRAVDSILENWQKKNPKAEDMIIPKIRVRVDQTTARAGIIVPYGWSAYSFPDFGSLLDTHESKVMVYRPSFEDKMIHEKLPLFLQVAPEKLIADASRSQMLDLALLDYLGHEASHTLIRYPRDEERLGGSFISFNEMQATSSGMEAVSELAQVDDFGREFLLNWFSADVAFEALEAMRGNREEYDLGVRLIFNALAEQKLYRIVDGRVHWDTPNRVYDGLSRFNQKLKRIATSGTEDDFKSLVNLFESKRRVHQLKPLLRYSRSSTQSHCISA